jgi:hypothetical protein
VTLDIEQKIDLVGLLEEELKVIRNITGMFIRNHTWKKAHTLHMTIQDGKQIQHVGDILESIVHEMTRLNWATKGFTALRLQFEGGVWSKRSKRMDLVELPFSITRSMTATLDYAKLQKEHYLLVTYQTKDETGEFHCYPQSSEKQ